MLYYHTIYTYIISYKIRGSSADAASRAACAASSAVSAAEGAWIFADFDSFNPMQTLFIAFEPTDAIQSHDLDWARFSLSSILIAFPHKALPNQKQQAVTQHLDDHVGAEFETSHVYIHTGTSAELPSTW